MKVGLLYKGGYCPNLEYYSMSFNVSSTQLVTGDWHYTFHPDDKTGWALKVLRQIEAPINCEEGLLMQTFTFNLG